MNKKFKKTLATVSALVVCSVSVVSTCAGAIAMYIDNTGDIYEEYTEFGANIVRTATKNNSYAYYYKDGNMISPIHFYFDKYLNIEVEKAEKLRDFLAENYPSVTVEYDILEGKNTTSVNLNYNEELSSEQKLQIAVDIKKNINLSCMTSVLLSSGIEVTEVVNELPEPTLLGDTDCNGSVNINDAILVMQSIVNPDKYKLSEQGKANADVVGDGNGITNGDALAIQEIAATGTYE